jgi:ribonuclease III
MPQTFNQQLIDFQTKINYKFKDFHLLETAMVHRSYMNEKHKFNHILEHNERLEFLGDAVAEIVVTDYLFRNFKQAEGFLTSLRASIVNYKNMGQVGVELGLEEIILISNGEKSELGKARLTIVADAVEAIIGAIYLDGGYDCAKEFVDKYLIIKLPGLMERKAYTDNKTQLQEYTQKYFHNTPKYQIVNSSGKDHDKQFTVSVSLGEIALAIGEGRSKQEAEIKAAGIALEKYLNDTNLFTAFSDKNEESII